MKLLTQRIRYRNLLDIGLDNFTTWYSSFGPNADNNSFPSGHTAMGWMFLPFLISVRNFKWKHPLKILTIVGIFSFGLFVGLSRIKVGAHYASDVLFPSCAGFVYTLFLYRWLYYSKEISSEQTNEKKTITQNSS